MPAEINGITVPSFDAEGNMLIVPEPRAGTKHNVFSINWCDKCSWYYGSTKATEETLVDAGYGTTFTSSNTHWIDMTHGRITDENRTVSAAQTAGTDDWLPIITVDDEVKTEGTDFNIDYENGSVTFGSSQAGNTVKATYWYANTGNFVLTVPAGKKLQLLRVEVQFSKTIVLNDVMVFTPKGLVDIFAPNLMPGVPSGTLIPLDEPNYYKNPRDYINESNGSFPLIPAWGGLEDETVILVWEYLSRTDLYGDYGMQIDISMANNTPHTGEISVATFYGILKDA